MAEQLWILRHGEAEPHDARPDPQRRLTERGEGQSRAAGRALAALELTFQLVATSPRVLQAQGSVPESDSPRLHRRTRALRSR